MLCSVFDVVCVRFGICMLVVVVVVIIFSCEILKVWLRGFWVMLISCMWL